MESQKIAVILFANLVTRKDNHVLRVIPLYKINVLVNCIGCSLVPVRTCCLLVRREHMNPAVEPVQIPRLSVSYVLVQYKRLILCKDTYRINP